MWLLWTLPKRLSVVFGPKPWNHVPRGKWELEKQESPLLAPPTHCVLHSRKQTPPGHSERAAHEESSFGPPMQKPAPGGHVNGTGVGPGEGEGDGKGVVAGAGSQPPTPRVQPKALTLGLNTVASDWRQPAGKSGMFSNSFMSTIPAGIS